MHLNNLEQNQSILIQLWWHLIETCCVSQIYKYIWHLWSLCQLAVKRLCRLRRPNGLLSHFMFPFSFVFPRSYFLPNWTVTASLQPSMKAKAEFETNNKKIKKSAIQRLVLAKAVDIALCVRTPTFAASHYQLVCLLAVALVPQKCPLQPNYLSHSYVPAKPSSWMSHQCIP